MDAGSELISGCLEHNPVAENKLYNLFCDEMYGVCLRFAGNERDAMEILQLGFIRVFHFLHQYRFNGQLGGWIKRIIINTAVTYCKRNARYLREVELKESTLDATFSKEVLSIITETELLDIIQELPVGSRTVFNLYVIEDYTHKEIGAMLGISESTSKSQYHRAKASIRTRLKALGIDENSFY
jgi:RNA polymerase sigma factor (sigma-70 family)